MCHMWARLYYIMWLFNSKNVMKSFQTETDFCQTTQIKGVWQICRKFLSVFEKYEFELRFSFVIPHLTHRLRFTLSGYFTYFQWKLLFAEKFCSSHRVKLIFQLKEFGPKPSINFLLIFQTHMNTYIGPIILINDNHLVWKTFFCARKVKFCMFWCTENIIL